MTISIPNLNSLHYTGAEVCVCWEGYGVKEVEFQTFMSGPVRERCSDSEELEELHATIQGIKTTGMDSNYLEVPRRQCGR